MSRPLLPAVVALLAAYEQYKQLAAQKETLATELAKAKLRGESTHERAEQYRELSERVQAVSDAMTYATPLEWIQYKYEAYKHEAQPITTMSDFRVHCSKPGYICTKRFTFLNQALEQRGERPLSDRQKYPDGRLLDDVLDETTLLRLVADDDFDRQWRAYEFFEANGRVAKWENFS